MANIIIAAVPIYGHVAPMRAIAVDLIRRGHRVTFITGSLFRDAVDEPGMDFIPLTGLADYDITKIDELWPTRASIPPGPQRFDFDLQVFVDGMPYQHEALQDALAKAGDEPTVVLYDTMFFGAAPILLGAPGIRPAGVVGVGVVPLMITSVDTAPFGMGAPPDSSEEGRARNSETNAMVAAQVFKDSQSHLVDTLRGLGATEQPPFILDSPVSLPDRFLQLAVPSLEYPRSDAPAGLRYIGGLTDTGSRSSRPLPTWWDDVLAADKVVVVSQGTVGNVDFTQLVEPTLRALADLDVLVIATLGREATLTDVPANARVAEFIPFDQLLPHVDVLVSNGGYGGVQQALSYGVPMVLAGLSEDKAEVTARTAWTGAAINLATERPEEGRIREAVEKILSTPSFRQHTRRLQDEYAAYDPFTAIDATIAELVGDSRS
ncbi:glycosyltransferase [Micromonospora sp. NPDC048898]|uniref:glycosyltransferase n=1 Tax=Micromonospora sp. NPDC048898 TaxID=3364260 RepID=UPI003716AAB4